MITKFDKQQASTSFAILILLFEKILVNRNSTTRAGFNNCTYLCSKSWISTIMLFADDSIVDDAIGVFLKNSFTLDKVNQFKDLGLGIKIKLLVILTESSMIDSQQVSVAMDSKNKLLYDQVTLASADKAKKCCLTYV